MTRIHAIATPKLCQDRKVAAIQDACDRRGLRVILYEADLTSRLLRCNWRRFKYGFYPKYLVAIPKLCSYAGIMDLVYSGAIVTMGLGDLVQKAVYLGIGVASYAGEIAGEKLSDLRGQIQKLADEMVERGEMNAEEARKFVDEMVSKAQQNPAEPTASAKPAEPRRIEIVTDDEEPAAAPPSQTEEMRRQVMELQEELRRLRNDKT